MGKTHSFEHHSRQTPDATYFTVRGFLVQPTVKLADRRRGTLFLDALDEAMVVSSQDNPVDRLAGKLLELDKPRFRLSCRPIDWIDARAAILSDCAPAGRLDVVRLLPLDEKQVRLIAEQYHVDADDFLTGMHDAGLAPLLWNPQTLTMALELAKQGAIPTSRFALFERFCALMVREANKQHRGSGLSGPSDDALLEAAQTVCAMLLIADKSGVALGSDNIDDFADLGVFRKDLDSSVLEGALKSRLFRVAGGGLIEPQHRTVAEFLGAGFLARRVTKHGLPLERVRALLCGDHDTPHPALRGLFAWLATLLGDRAETLIRSDPYGVFSYGDPDRLSPAARRTAVRALGSLADNDPFFRAGSWSAARFPALAAPELVDDLRDVLRERPPRPHLASCIFEALAEGEPRPELLDDLRVYLLDPSIPADDRQDAVAAFIRVGRHEPAECAATFRTLARNPEIDPDGALAGSLLLRLYPEHLGPEDLVGLLARYGQRNDNDSAHLAYHLPGRIPDDHRTMFLDALAQQHKAQQHNAQRRRWSDPGYVVCRLARQLMLRLLPHLDVLEIERLKAWLPLLGRHVPSAREEDEALRGAFADRFDLVPPLVLVFAGELEPAIRSQRPEDALYDLLREVPWLPRPSDAAERMLAAALKEQDDRDALVLFAVAWRFAASGFFEGSGTIDRLWNAAKAPEWIAVRDRSCAPVPWEEHHKDEACNRWRWRRKEERERRRVVDKLRAREATIRSGEDTAALAFLADYWFDRHARDRDDSPLSPRARLERRFGVEVADMAEEGFCNLVRAGELPDAASMARWALDNQHPMLVYAILAGVDILHERGCLIDCGIDPQDLASAVCIALSYSTFDREKVQERLWVNIIINKYLGYIEDFISQYLLNNKELSVYATHFLNIIVMDDRLAQVHMKILREITASIGVESPYFNHVMKTACRTHDRVSLLRVVEGRLAEVEEKPEERWPWLHLAWRLCPDRYGEALVEAARQSTDRLWDLIEWANDSGGFREPLPMALDVGQRVTMVELVGVAFLPMPSPPKGMFGSRHSHIASRFVLRQLDHLASAPGGEARDGLTRLLATSTLEAYHPYILHALAAWHRADRERGFFPPPLRRVADALRGGAPASGADLKAFVVEHLTDLDRELRTTAHQMWRHFWNTSTGSGEPIEPRRENDCRDQIVTILRGRFERAGLAQGTEVRQVGDSRCDIVVGDLERIMPIEVKRDTHGELWTAWRDQLLTQYAVDPEASGLGIYLVLWFGDLRKGRVPRPPDGIARPSSADECREMLRTILAGQDHNELEVVVLDLSPPTS